MPAPTLVNLAMKACQKYYRGIQDVGGLPYDMVRPFLIKIDNAEQLHAIESSSPQIIGRVSEMWKQFIIRDIPPNVRDEYDYEPDDPAHWYRAYKKLRRKVEQKAEEAGKMIQMAVKNSKSAREAPNLINPLNGPRLPGLKRGQRGPTLAPDSRARVGKSILNDIRGGPKITKTSKNGGLWMKPSKSSNVRRHIGQVSHAPVRMVQEKTETLPKASPSTERAAPQARNVKKAAAPPSSTTLSADSSSLSVVERRRQAEERLKGIGLEPRQTSPTKSGPAPRVEQKRPLMKRPTSSNVFMTRKKNVPR